MTHPADNADNAEIAAAVTLLERAECEFPSQQSADAFSDAFDLLDDVLACDSPGDAAVNYIGNVKYAHCKRIASRLADVDARDFEVWFHYAVLLLVTMKAEFEALRAAHPDLGRLYDQCMGRHGAALQSAADSLAKSRG